MKKFILFASFALLAACTSESTLDNGNDNGQSSIVELTSIVLDEHEIILEKGMEKVLKVEFFPENATNKKVTWTSSNENVVKVKDGVVVGVAPGTAEVIVRSLKNIFDKCKVSVIVSAQSISLDKTKLTLVPGETASLKATVLPEDSTEGVEWFSSDESVATVKEGEVSAISEGEVVISAKAGKQSAMCSITVAWAVDLGLSVKWAARNIGASWPLEIGDYYSWGDIDTYYYDDVKPDLWISYKPIWKIGKSEDYSWVDYKWCNGTDTSFTKYCPADKTDYWDGIGAPDGKTVLDLEDDVANVKLGGNWRIPTEAQWRELLNHCSYTVYLNHQYYNHGVFSFGVLFTSKINGNSIFLPAGGFAGITNDNKYTSYRRTDIKNSWYWSSSLTSPSYAKCAFFGYHSSPFTSKPRRLGLLIRPVCD